MASFYCPDECAGKTEEQRREWCRFCIRWEQQGNFWNTKCSREIPYEMRFPCRQCKIGPHGSIITDKQIPCKECKVEETIIGPQRSNGVFNIRHVPSDPWVDKTSGGVKNGIIQNALNCYKCVERSGREEWISKCPPGSTCIKGECQPDCDPACTEGCEKCECTEWVSRTLPGKKKPSKICIKRGCVSLCKLTNYICTDSPQGGKNICDCMFAPSGAPARPGQTRCPKIRPFVVGIRDKQKNVTGCECKCVVSPEDCLNTEYFDGGNCRCVKKCDPECDTQECEECRETNITGVFSCQSTCVPPERCDGEGNCYKPFGVLSLDLVP